MVDMFDVLSFIPRCPTVREKTELDSYGALVLSAVGDGVHTLFLRCALSAVFRYRPEDLHKEVSRFARAEAQCEALKKIEPILNEEEMQIVKRGRNAHPHNIPKHATQYEYRAASGFEALTGYLYLSGRGDRLGELFDTIYGETFSGLLVSDTQTEEIKKNKEGN